MTSKAIEVTKQLAEVMGVPYGHYTYHDTEPDLSELDPQYGGGESPTAYKVKTRDGRWVTTQPNALEADFNGHYGGWVIQQIAPNGRTWISNPFGSTRRRLSGFVSFVEDLIEQQRKEGE